MKIDGANAGLSANQESKGGFSQSIESSRERLGEARVARNDARAALVEARNSGSKSERQAAFSELRQAKLEVQEARADLREARGGKAGAEVSSPGTGGNFFNGNEFTPETDSNGSLTPEQKLQFGIPPGAIVVGPATDQNVLVPRIEVSSPGTGVEFIDGNDLTSEQETFGLTQEQNVQLEQRVRFGIPPGAIVVGPATIR